MRNYRSVFYPAYRILLELAKENENAPSATRQDETDEAIDTESIRIDRLMVDSTIASRREQTKNELYK